MPRVLCGPYDGGKFTSAYHPIIHQYPTSTSTMEYGRAISHLGRSHATTLTPSCFWRRLPGKSQLKGSDQMLCLEVISASSRAGLASCIWPISLLPFAWNRFLPLLVSSNNVHSRHFCLSFQRTTSVFDHLLTNHFPSP